ncbi:MAG: hypothetical protein AAF725_14205, partial [Acidobacteriota bacterium]
MRLDEVLKASETLHERLARFLSAERPLASPAPPASREALRGTLGPWAKAASGGEDFDLFERRLAWDGLDLETAAAAWSGQIPAPAGEGESSSDSPEEWVEILRRATEPRAPGAAAPGPGG